MINLQTTLIYSIDVLSKCNVALRKFLVICNPSSAWSLSWPEEIGKMWNSSEYYFSVFCATCHHQVQVHFIIDLCIRQEFKLNCSNIHFCIDKLNSIFTFQMSTRICLSLSWVWGWFIIKGWPRSLSHWHCRECTIAQNIKNFTR